MMAISSRGTWWGLVAVVCVMSLAGLAAQRGGRGGAPGGRGGPFGAAPDNLPSSPEVAPLPSITGPVTGPGAIYESVESLPPGGDLAHNGYVAQEYFVSGTADGAPYKTRIVVRRPRNDADFSGLVLVEPMHPSGNAHMFEYTSEYTMDAGHIAVEIVVAGQQLLIDANQARYGDIAVAPGQVTHVLAQVGALLKERASGNPLAGLPMRKMVMAGTSATAAILIRYLPAHAVLRTSNMQQIYDGYMPEATGATIQQVDAPLIQIPTMTEVSGGNITARQDGDEPGDQFRVYEFAGIAHIDTRDNVRTAPNPCSEPLSRFPVQAYVAVTLHHLLRWVDEGVAPPHAPRVLRDRDTTNDGSLMALDEHGNPRGGIRNPYVDVPVAQYAVPNGAAASLPANPSKWIQANGQNGANLLCRLSGYEKDLSRDQLRSLYGNAGAYRQQVERRLTELEQAGWSLPVYREMILADAAAVRF